MNERHWTSHIEFMVLLTTLIGGFYLLDGKIERTICRMDDKMELAISQQSARTDRLYEMFIDLIREKR